jgi:hypothetical protein
VKARRTRTGSSFWYAATGVIVIVGALLVVMSRGSNAQEPPLANKDHWHAALGVNVCGTWLPNAPQFEYRDGSTTVRAGLHSHGDGLMHIHPFSSDEAGNRATVGQFLEYGGWSVSEDEIDAWDNAVHRNGQECDGKQASVRWSVNGDEKSGNPADFQPKDADVVAIAFLPEGEEIGTPPSAGATPTDLPAGEGASPGATVPGATVPGATVPGQTSAPTGTTVPGATAAPTTAAPTTAAPTSAP